MPPKPIQKKQFPYRPNVSMMILRDDGRVLMIFEKGEKDSMWKFPQGGVEWGEPNELAVKRELKEEVNITHYQILRKATYVHHYEWPREMQKRKGYRGQAQTIFQILAQKPEEAKSGEKKILRLEWLPFDQAIERLKFKDQKTAAKRAWEEFGRADENT